MTAAPYRAMFGDAPAGGSLQKWKKFEELHPDTLIGMCQFWCRKSPGKV